MKLIVYTDNKTNPTANNNFIMGHFYVQLVGTTIGGLQVNKFYGKYPAISSPYFWGTIKNDDNKRILKENGEVDGSITRIQKVVNLSQLQFNNAYSAAESKEIIPGFYKVTSNNCVDFANEIYNAAGQLGDIADLFTTEELKKLDTGATTYALSKYGAHGGVRVVSGSELGEVAKNYDISWNELLKAQENYYFNRRFLIEDSTNYYIILPVQDKLSLPSKETPNTYTPHALCTAQDSNMLSTYTGPAIVIGTSGNDLFQGAKGSTSFFTKGGFDTINAGSSTDYYYIGSGTKLIQDNGGGNQYNLLPGHQGTVQINDAGKIGVILKEDTVIKGLAERLTDTQGVPFSSQYLMKQNGKAYKVTRGHINKKSQLGRHVSGFTRDENGNDIEIKNGGSTIQLLDTDLSCHGQFGIRLSEDGERVVAQSGSGVAVRLKDGTVMTITYVDNVGYLQRVSASGRLLESVPVANDNSPSACIAA